MSLERAQQAWDNAVPPGTFRPEVESSAYDAYQDFWNAITFVMATAKGNAVGEAMGAPALTHDWSSIDIGFQFARGCERELIAMLRAAADAGEAWLDKNGRLPE